MYFEADMVGSLVSLTCHAHIPSQKVVPINYSRLSMRSKVILGGFSLAFSDHFIWFQGISSCTSKKKVTLSGEARINGYFP